MPEGLVIPLPFASCSHRPDV